MLRPYKLTEAADPLDIEVILLSYAKITLAVKAESSLVKIIGVPNRPELNCAEEI